MLAEHARVALQAHALRVFRFGAADDDAAPRADDFEIRALALLLPAHRWIPPCVRSRVPPIKTGDGPIYGPPPDPPLARPVRAATL